ncbi:signal recognition particle protein [Lignipirellula cremea]|uniref:Signal recognition particle protein n=1 Tax=Lignipirellula cremea TaxID=2528010 RepID=A0A518E1I4_9BACT|nr:signal recognition particle protein [Lignipirellula cremea]QDU97949.1 Signal recognition particle protein [Lignipirellula cremea]
MFDSLQKNLQQAFKSISGRGTLTESNMRDGLRLIEESLLEADVSYEVVKKFMAEVSEKALGEKVLLKLNPGEQLVGIVHQQLIDTLGPVDPSIPLRNTPTVLMLCGLQGSGKTTTCGKLAKLLLKQNIRPLLCAADLQRPAAIEQLHVLGKQLGVPVYSEPGATDPVKVCRNAKAKAEAEGAKVVILDTAGRLAIDAELMEQLRQIDRRTNPDQIFLVVDGMTGQDAVLSAKAFNDALSIDGVIMTKLDGDARGGALLSVKAVTEVPVKFIGVGEKLEDLEPFRPEGMASRILGMGDVVALVDTIRSEVDADAQKKAEEQWSKGQFTLDDLKKQMEMMAKPGLIKKLLGAMPGGGQLMEMMGAGGSGEADIKRLIGVINSMTPAERKNPKLIDPSRRRRIAHGAGVPPQQVTDVVKQHDMMKSMVTGLAGKGMGERMQMLNQVQEAATNPMGGMPKTKKGTGKRLSPAEKAKLKKQRDREMRKKKKGK